MNTLENDLILVFKELIDCLFLARGDNVTSEKLI